MKEICNDISYDDTDQMIIIILIFTNVMNMQMLTIGPQFKLCNFNKLYKFCKLFSCMYWSDLR